MCECCLVKLIALQSEIKLVKWINNRLMTLFHHPKSINTLLILYTSDAFITVPFTKSDDRTERKHYRGHCLVTRLQKFQCWIVCDTEVMHTMDGSSTIERVVDYVYNDV